MSERLTAVDGGKTGGNLNQPNYQSQADKWVTHVPNPGQRSGHEIMVSLRGKLVPVVTADDAEAAYQAQHDADVSRQNRSYWKSNLTADAKPSEFEQALGSISIERGVELANQAKHDVAAALGYGHKNIDRLPDDKYRQFDDLMTVRHQALVINEAEQNAPVEPVPGVNYSHGMEQLNRAERRQVYRQAQLATMVEMGIDSQRQLERLEKSKDGTKDHDKYIEFLMRLANNTATRADDLADRQNGLERSGADMDSKVGDLTKNKQIDGQDGDLKLSQLVDDKDVNPYFRIDGIHQPKAKVETEVDKAMEEITTMASRPSDKVQTNDKLEAAVDRVMNRIYDRVGQEPAGETARRNQARVAQADAKPEPSKPEASGLEALKKQEIIFATNKSNQVISDIYDHIRPLWKETPRQAFDSLTSYGMLGRDFFDYDKDTQRPKLSDYAKQLWHKWINRHPRDWRKSYNEAGQWYSDRYGAKVIDRYGLTDNQRSNLFAINSILRQARQEEKR